MRNEIQMKESSDITSRRRPCRSSAHHRCRHTHSWCPVRCLSKLFRLSARTCHLACTQTACSAVLSQRGGSVNSKKSRPSPHLGTHLGKVLLVDWGEGWGAEEEAPSTDLDDCCVYNAHDNFSHQPCMSRGWSIMLTSAETWAYGGIGSKMSPPISLRSPSGMDRVVDPRHRVGHADGAPGGLYISLLAQQ